MSKSLPRKGKEGRGHHAATHRKTLQHTAKHCNTLQHTTTLHNAPSYNTVQRTQTLQHTVSSPHLTLGVSHIRYCDAYGKFKRTYTYMCT